MTKLTKIRNTDKLTMRRKTNRRRTDSGLTDRYKTYVQAGKSDEKPTGKEQTHEEIDKGLRITVTHTLDTNRQMTEVMID